VPGPTRPRACARGGHRGRTGGRPAVGRVARGCAPHDWRLGRPAGRCNREWEVPLGACKLPVGGPTGSLQAPSGIPSGTSPGPTGSASGTFKARLEKRVGARRERLGRPTGTLGLWRGAIAESHSPARGAPRVLPLGGRATTVRAPLRFLWGTFLTIFRTKMKKTRAQRT